MAYNEEEQRWDDADYWTGLVDGLLHIESVPMLRRGHVPLVVPGGADHRRRLIEDGFFSLEAPEESEADSEADFEDLPMGWGVDVAKIAAAIVKLGEAGWPPVYILVFDEPWVLRARMGHALARCGDLVPNFDWAAFHVRRGAEDGAAAAGVAGAGWAPHRDRDDVSLAAAGAAAGFDADGAARHVTCWVALTDAGPESSCLYCVRRRDDPGYRDGDRGRSPLEAIFATSPASFRAVRCLGPTEAGGAVCFSHRLLHWGSSPDSGAPARIAISFGSNPPSNDDGASFGAFASNVAGEPFKLRPTTVAPPLRTRVSLAAAQLFVYARSSEPTVDTTESVHRDRHWRAFKRGAAVFHDHYVSIVAAEMAFSAGSAAAS
ncbi:hypothetical protein M885DRAFT_588030 [Pelagophyceae sp. CCMP2097]|nr:hypothetical protein M885DRAFT_588030 [Pelagophyceae sp. CCMP2097]